MEVHRCINCRSNLLILVLIVSGAANLVAASASKVELNLYYESLCPSCADFIINSLYKLFDNGLISIVDLKLSPYGNAKIGSDGAIVCQHGEWECILNNVEACAIKAWPDVSDHFPYIYCVENLTYHEEYANWETCFKKVNVDPKPVLDCYSTGFAHELALQYDDEIKALKPPHTYVPWVVLDGQPLHDDYMDVISFICKAYKGSNTPKACLGLSLPITTRKDTANSLNHICYKEDKSKSKILEIISWMQYHDMAE